MGYLSEPSILLDKTFSDVDDMTVQTRQWDLDFRQLERGPFSGHILQFGLDGVHVAEARFHRKLRQLGAPPAALRTVAVPANPDLKMEWRGKTVDGNSLMVFPIGAELSSVSRQDFHVYTCTLPEQVLNAACNQLELGEFQQLVGGVEAIRVAAEAMNTLRTLLRKVCDSVSQSPADLSSIRVREQLNTILPNRLVSAIANSQGECPAFAVRSRLLAVSRAEAFLDKYGLTDRIEMDDLCNAAGVSERTLRYAFLERFGVGPKEFLQVHRLIAVRRELRTADPKTTRVADIANAWGFWHQGQFAADYRRRFGELPSATLLRSTN